MSIRVRITLSLLTKGVFVRAGLVWLYPVPQVVLRASTLAYARN